MQSKKTYGYQLSERFMNKETRALLTLACKRLRKLYAVVSRFTRIEGWKEGAGEGGKVNVLAIHSLRCCLTLCSGL